MKRGNQKIKKNKESRETEYKTW